MPSKYDDWERLVGAVVKREQLRQIALTHSMDSSTSSFTSSFRFDHLDTIDDTSIMERSVPAGVVFLPVEAREFVIHTNELRDGQPPYSSRYFDTIEINSGLPFDIRGKIRTHLLTSKTIYGAYLVYKLYYDEFIGNCSAKATIRFGEDDRDVDAETQAKTVNLQPISELGDGWMELQIGSFYVDDGDDSEVEARLMETSGCRKTGLIVEGIKFQPLVS